MQQSIFDALHRQAQGTELLCMLLQEEYALLRAGRPDHVAGLEMSIQELIRQLVRERECMRRLLNGWGYAGLNDFVGRVDGPSADNFLLWRRKLADWEQDCARQATMNADLAMAMWKQSGQLLSHFQNQVAPRERNTYTAKGSWHNRPSTAALVRGRL
ncbi:MAG: flagellar protein FlgN [Desulfovibrionales bacterium]|nr:flagellar protein FlgN [Desulfovibrionales bacterium]